MPKDKEVLIFEGGFELTNYMIKKWADLAQEAVGQRGRFTVALPGGRSPMEFYSRLSSLKDFHLWQKTHVFIGDERFVPFDHESSNFKMIKTNLLDYVNIPEGNIHPIKTDCKNAELAAEQFKNELIEFFEFKENRFPVFDLMMLGVGIDGHTASLFPQDERINDAGRIVLPVSLPHLKEDRITLTLPVINHSRHAIILEVGARKADILKQIIDEHADVPAAKVQLTDGQLLFLLDKEAARKLSYRESYSNEGQAVRYDPSI